MVPHQSKSWYYTLASLHQPFFAPCDHVNVVHGAVVEDPPRDGQVLDGGQGGVAGDGRDLVDVADLAWENGREREIYGISRFFTRKAALTMKQQNNLALSPNRQQQHSRH